MRMSDLFVQGLGNRQQLHSNCLRITPNTDGLLYVRNLAEIHKQTDHPIDIIGMVTSLDKASARCLHIPVGLQQFVARSSITHRNPHELLKELVVPFCTRDAVSVQVKDS